jgi:hypothetical protein
MVRRDRRRRVGWWDLLASVAIATFPPYVAIGEPVWRAPPPIVIQMLFLVLAYLWGARLGRHAVGGIAQLLTGTVLFGVAYLAGDLLSHTRHGAEFSREITMMAFGIGVVSMAGSIWLATRVQPALIAGMVFCGAWILALGRDDDPPPGGPEYQFSALYPLMFHTFEFLVEGDGVYPGGGIARADSGAVAVTGAGAFVRLAWDSDSAVVRSSPIPLASPADDSEFRKVLPRGEFRVHDVALRRSAGGWDLYVSHHVWSAAERCIGLAVSHAGLTPALDSATTTWTEIWRTRQCLSVANDQRGAAFVGLESGGRLAWFGPDTLLLTTGDHEFNGVNRSPAVSQDTASEFGKTLTIDLATGRASLFTLGHRNPQGLFVARDGRICPACASTAGSARSSARTRRSV